jgi:hypothetical protein
MWEPQRLTTLWASTACYTDSFTFFFAILNPSKARLEHHIHPSEALEVHVHLDADETDAELAIKELQNYTAPGTDGLPGEVFKYGGDILNIYIS